MEEAGWRYILQPELDKKHGFILSSVITGIIWSLWHLPLFFIPEVTQYGWNFGYFMIGIFSLTFALGAIRKISGNVFLCVLAHSMFNAASGVFFFEQTVIYDLISAGLVIVISIFAVFIWKQKMSRG